MARISVGEIVKATEGTLLCGDEDTQVCRITTDSRDVKPGDLFVPLIGERTNPHKFIEEVLEVGAATLTMEHFAIKADKPYIRVEDTQKALTRLGHLFREKNSSLPIVAVTGSVGKTTTRHMIAQALSSAVNTFETYKNYNSQVGVPIMLSWIQPEHDLAVLECGMSEFGQIHILSDMIKPQAAVVTTIGVAHIEQLLTRENILKEKLSIVDGLEDGGYLFLNGDDELLASVREQMTGRVLWYGTKEWCDYRALDARFEDGMSYFTWVHEDQQIPVQLNTVGMHNVVNCVVALAMVDYFGYDVAGAAEQFKEFEGLRQKFIHTENGYVIIDDTYNASPDSMKASLNVLCCTECEGKRVAVLGDMFELGDDSEQYHYEVGAYLSTLDIDELVVVGEHAKYILQAVQDSDNRMRCYTFMDNDEVAMYLMGTLMPGDVVMIKGSNGMKMDEIVRLIEQSN